MSATDMALPVPKRSTATLAQVRRAQLLSVWRLELKKNFFRVRGAWVQLLAFGPVAIIGLHAIVEMMRGGGPRCNVEEDTLVLAGIFQLFYLRLGIFFGCAGIFTRLFRGDFTERTLHYYFLTPLRREILVLGKTLAGITAGFFFFSLGVLLSFILMYVHHGSAGRDFVFRGPGLGHLGAYFAATLLAVVGYGSVFLLTGMLFRNPIIPAALLLLWETINFVLPATLKHLSIIFYVLPLCPVEVPEKGLSALLAVSADPVSAWMSVPGLLLLAACILAYACWRIRSVEIDYGTD